MAIVINVDVMLAKRKMSVTELSERVGITMANISILKNGRAKAIKLDTLDKICKALDCQLVFPPQFICLADQMRQGRGQNREHDKNKDDEQQKNSDGRRKAFQKGKPHNSRKPDHRQNRGQTADHKKRFRIFF